VNLPNIMQPSPPLPSSDHPVTTSTVRKKNARLALWSFGLGIFSVVLSIYSVFIGVFVLLTGIIGIVTGHIAIGRTRPQSIHAGRGFAIAGLVMSYLASVVSVFGIFLLIDNFAEIKEEFFRSSLVGSWRYEEGSPLTYVSLVLDSEGSITRTVYVVGNKAGEFSGKFSNTGDGRLIFRFSEPYETNEVHRFTLRGDVLQLVDKDGDSEDYIRVD
jgi:hypothetical protein